MAKPPEPPERPLFSPPFSWSAHFPRNEENVRGPTPGGFKGGGAPLVQGVRSNEKQWSPEGT